MEAPSQGATEMLLLQVGIPPSDCSKIRLFCRGARILSAIWRSSRDVWPEHGAARAAPTRRGAPIDAPGPRGLGGPACGLRAAARAAAHGPDCREGRFWAKKRAFLGGNGANCPASRTPCGLKLGPEGRGGPAGRNNRLFGAAQPRPRSCGRIGENRPKNTTWKTTAAARPWSHNAKEGKNVL